MSFQLVPLDENKSGLIFTGEPGYIHALEMAPASREKELDSGTWLIVTFPVWSGPARHSVIAAINLAKEFGGTFQLGVRPYDDHNEIHKWWPVRDVPAPANQLIEVREESSHRAIHITSDPAANPIWLLLRDGKVLYQGAGPRSKEELKEIMIRHL